MKLYWHRISLSKGVKAEAVESAKKAAVNHSSGKLPKLPFTEANYEWVLLYEHAQIGQITSETMRYMKRRDLYYLAGMTFPHPELTQPMSDNEKKFPGIGAHKTRWSRATKLQGNAVRAKFEIDRRNSFWVTLFTVSAALVGAAIGFMIGGTW